MKDEARCLMAAAYFNLFRFYGGLPIITQTFTVLNLHTRVAVQHRKPSTTS